VKGLADHRDDALHMKVRDFMTTSVATRSPEGGLEKIMLEMTELYTRHFPVVARGRLVGIVSIGDVVKNRLDEVQLEKKVLQDSYIVGR
jgi:CBS domain-containing protein